jgi:hypothetical protein
MRVRILDGGYAIARLPADAEIPAWVGGPFCSLTRTVDELSIVVAENLLPAGVTAEAGWRLLAVEGPLDFSQIGVLASLADPLTAAEVSLFAISTYDTDYLMVRRTDLQRAREVLEKAGHEFLDGRS